VSFGTDGKFIDVKALTVTGTYKVTIDPQGNATGSVDVTLYLLPADPSANATPTAGGAAASVTTTVPGQNAKISFTATANQRFAFTLVSFGSGSCSAKMSLTKPNGATITYPFLGCGESGDWFETKTLDLAGIYKLVVDPQGTATGTASFTLYSPSADVVGTLGGSTTAILTPGQNGSYTFTVTGGPKTATITPSAGGTINLAGAHLQSQDGTAEYDVQFWDPSGGAAVSGSLATGTYRLFLDPVGNASGSISFGLALT
jgi:hypothetical protein